MTKPISQMNQTELIWYLEGQAMSARRIMDSDKDPSQTLSRMKSIIERYPSAPKANSDGSSK